MLFSWREDPGARRLLLSLLLLAAWRTGSGQLHYSVPEEAKHGTFVGRIAQDLGLELAELVPRLFRVASKDRGDLLEVNLQNGILFVNSRIDREELCGRSAECSIHLEVIVDRPLQVFHVEVEVKDINDNPPVFPMAVKNLFISESRQPGSRFSLEGASDADIGTNSLLTYNLDSTEYFTLDVKRNDEEIKSLGLVLKKLLNREDTPRHHLLITAVDGGKPELTGTTQVKITVLDVNDNAPEFERSVYKVRLFENVPNGTLAVIVNASDLDEGVNKDIVYSFNTDTSAYILSKFHLDPVNGYISVKGNIDFEETKSYEIQVEATDKGNPPMADHCTVLVEILDVNDNVPELVIKSLSLPVLEDSPLGTVIALISVSDRDSGANGQVTCNLTTHVPFKLVSTFKNYYSLVLDSPLDRETVSVYDLVVTARDGGSPSLWATASVSVEVADVNDNAPAFAQPINGVREGEQPAGCHIFTVSARTRTRRRTRGVVLAGGAAGGKRALSSYVSVHAESGKVYALQPLDHEELELLRFQVFVLDEKNKRQRCWRLGVAPLRVSELLSGLWGAGHVWAKVRAVDADSGTTRGCRMSWSRGGKRAQPVPRGAVHRRDQHERALDEADAPRQRLLVLVRDHGEPALTATATVLVSLVEGAQAPKASSRALAALWPGGGAGGCHVYLIIAIWRCPACWCSRCCCNTALRCSARPSEGACGPGKPRLVCSSAVGSWSHSQQRRQRVCSGEGLPKTDLMAFSPSLSPCPVSKDREEQQDVDIDLHAKIDIYFN
nr:protocadherin alpha-3-like [Microcebus murinus]